MEREEYEGRLRYRYHIALLVVGGLAVLYGLRFRSRRADQHAYTAAPACIDGATAACRRVVPVKVVATWFDRRRRIRDAMVTLEIVDGAGPRPGRLRQVEVSKELHELLSDGSFTEAELWGDKVTQIAVGGASWATEQHPAPRMKALDLEALLVGVAMLPATVIFLLAGRGRLGTPGD